MASRPDKMTIGTARRARRGSPGPHGSGADRKEGSCGRQSGLHYENNTQAAFARTGAFDRLGPRSCHSLPPIAMSPCRHGARTAVQQALIQEDLLQPLSLAAVGAGVPPPAPAAAPSPAA